jgi:acyl-CoA synthetase (AMP-forming)/AMP-acid ligase II
LSASPAFLERLAEVCLPAGRSLDSLRKVFTGGAPVFPEQMERFQRLAPGAQIVAVYGSTEAEPIAQVSREDISGEDRAAMWAGRGLLAGLPDPAIRLRILGDLGRPAGGPLSEAQLNERTLPPEEPGEIVVSGPHVQPGYLHERGDEETKLRVNGTTWHRTGDAGYLDTRGRLWLLGRQGARIRDERGTLYPFQVECAAQRNVGVRRAALVAGRGARLLAVEPRSELDPRRLKAELAWAGIDRVELVRRLPLDQRHNAKIDYVALRRMLR